MSEQFGRRIEDVMQTDLSPEIIASLTDTQRVNLRIIQSLSQVNTAISNLNTTLTEIKNNVAEHDKILVTGNGVPSLQERVRNLETFMDSIKYWSRFLGGAVLLQTLTFAIATGIAVVRLLPILEKLASQP